MIVGNGLLASAFSKDFAEKADTIIFASGVSNSQEHLASAFMREKNLLKSIRREKKEIIYFSTCSLYDSELKDTPYVQHKYEMEELIQKFPNFFIFRLPQLVGKTSNTTTLSNFIYNNIIENKYFDVWRYAKRNLIDVSDVALIAKHILEHRLQVRQIINIANPISISVLNLVNIFELILEKKAIYSIQEKGSACKIDTELSSSIASKIGIVFDPSYMETLIRKYYCTEKL